MIGYSLRAICIQRGNKWMTCLRKSLDRSAISADGIYIKAFNSSLKTGNGSFLDDTSNCGISGTCKAISPEPEYVHNRLLKDLRCASDMKVWKQRNVKTQ